MKGSGMRSTSRKGNTEPKGRKNHEENERQLMGAGWTAAATRHFIDLPTDEERLVHWCAMFSISEEDYKCQGRQIITANVHLPHGLSCVEQKYDADKMQFVCRSMTELLDMIATVAQQPDSLHLDASRAQLLAKYQALLFKFNSEELRFTLT
jgi:hypothetical protein